jgi:hypothetical protein
MSVTIAEQDRPPPTSTGGVWDYISASRLNLWLKCGLAFKRRYIEGIRTPPTPSLFLGKRVHNGLEYFYRHKQLGIRLDAEQVASRIDATWEQAADEEGIQFASSGDEAHLNSQTVSLVEAYLNQIPVDEPPPLAMETSLEAPLVDPGSGEDLGIPLPGIVDLALDDRGSVICDFKTAASSTTPTEMQHEIQLGCYAFLYRAMAGPKEAGLEIRSLVKTKIPKVVIHRFAQRRDRHFQRLFAVVRVYLEDLERGRFLMRPGWIKEILCTLQSGYNSTRHIIAITTRLVH